MPKYNDVPEIFRLHEESKQIELAAYILDQEGGSLVYFQLANTAASNQLDPNLPVENQTRSVGISVTGNVPKELLGELRKFLSARQDEIVQQLEEYGVTETETLQA